MGTLRENVRSILNLFTRPLGLGQVFYVDSATGRSDYDGLSVDYPVATIAQAHALCTTGRGDKIVILAGHAENVATAGAITISKSNLEIIGNGIGSSRPTLSWSGTAGTFVISGSNVKLSNIVTTASIDEVVLGFSVSGAGVVFENVDFVETSSCQMISFLKTTTAADDIVIRKCKHFQVTAAAATQIWIELIGADRAVIEENDFTLVLRNHAGSSTIASTGTAPLNVIVRKNSIKQTGGTTQVSVILMMTGTTGMISDNRIAANTTTIAGQVAAASCYCHSNLCCKTTNKSGIVDPVVDADA